MGSVAISSGESSVVVRIKRPRFSTLWSSYAEVADKAAVDVYKLVGGSVEAARADNPYGYANACALRLSRAFNYGGYSIPKGTIVKGTPIYRLKGADQLAYIIKVLDFAAFLRHNWGKPDQSSIDFIAGKKGILAMEISGWSDASGHVTLWNGSETGDGSDYHRHDSHTYDNPQVKLQRVMFWELKG